MLPAETACGRCGRLTPAAELRLWTTRERLRVFSRQTQAQTQSQIAASAQAPAEAGALLLAPSSVEPAGAPPLAARQPTIAYRWVTAGHAVCADCFRTVSGDSARFDDVDRARAIRAVLTVIGVAVLLWACFAPFAHNWIAAFWRNGAGGR